MRAIGAAIAGVLAIGISLGPDAKNIASGLAGFFTGAKTTKSVSQSTRRLARYSTSRPRNMKKITGRNADMVDNLPASTGYIGPSLDPTMIEKAKVTIIKTSPDAVFDLNPYGAKVTNLKSGKEYEALEAIVENQPVRFKTASKKISIPKRIKSLNCRVERCPSPGAANRITGRCLNVSASRQGAGPVDLTFEAGPSSVSVTFKPAGPDLAFEVSLNDCLSLQYEPTAGINSTIELGTASCGCSLVFPHLAELLEREIPTNSAAR